MLDGVTYVGVFTGKFGADRFCYPVPGRYLGGIWWVEATLAGQEQVIN